MKFWITGAVATVLALALFAMPGTTGSTVYAVPGNHCGNDVVDVPDSGTTFDFAQACIGHDSCYGEGGSERDRRGCDDAFLEDMRASCAAGERWKRIGCNAVAFTYYVGVRIGGWAFFPYSAGT